MCAHVRASFLMRIYETPFSEAYICVSHTYTSFLIRICACLLSHTCSRSVYNLITFTLRVYLQSCILYVYSYYALPLSTHLYDTSHNLYCACIYKVPSCACIYTMPSLCPLALSTHLYNTCFFFPTHLSVVSYSAFIHFPL